MNSPGTFTVNMVSQSGTICPFWFFVHNFKNKANQTRVSATLHIDLHGKAHNKYVIFILDTSTLISSIYDPPLEEKRRRQGVVLDKIRCISRTRLLKIGEKTYLGISERNRLPCSIFKS